MHVLAQARFSPVLSISQSVPAIQDRLRHAGFPRFETSQVQQVRILEGKEVKVEQADRWDFMDRDKKTGVVLTKDFVVLHTSHYEIFESFRDRFRLVVESVANVVELSLSERTGLRYINLIRPEGTERMADYLKPGLVGYPFADATKVHAQLRTSRVESAADTTAGTLVVRCIQTSTGEFLPPDLWPSTLSHDVEVHQGELAAVLDIDHYNQTARDFDVSAVVDSLESLHDGIDVVFRHAVTPQAMTKWGQEIA